MLISNKGGIQAKSSFHKNKALKLLCRFRALLVFCLLIIIIQTRKFEIASIQFCIGDLILFGFIILSKPYELYRMMLSNCYP